MIQISTYILELILQYGYPVVAIVTFVGTLGVPIPTSTVLLAAGSFCLAGEFNIYLMIAISTTAVVIGDSIGYFIGKWLGKKYMRTVLLKFGVSTEKWQATSKYFNKWAGFAVFMTRWLITPIGVPINIISGTNNYPYKKFLAISFVGELIWTSIYISTGYIFGANWVEILAVIKDAPYIFVLIFIGLASILISRKMIK